MFDCAQWFQKAFFVCSFWGDGLAPRLPLPQRPWCEWSIKKLNLASHSAQAAKYIIHSRSALKVYMNSVISFNSVKSARCKHWKARTSLAFSCYIAS